MTNNQLNRERLEKIKSWRETYGAGSNVMLPAEEAEELACIALAEMDSEPVAWRAHCHRLDGTDAGFQYYDEADELGLRHPLYLHAQPAPVVPDGLLSMAASAIEDLLEHTDPNTSYYSGVWADVPGKLRAAMIAAAPQEVK